MDKTIQKVVLTTLLEKLDDDLVKLQEAWQGAVDDSAEAEGAMQTRYGSTKEEKDLLASSYGQKVLDLRDEIERLQSFKLPTTNSSIVLGTFFCVKGNSDAGSFFVILPVGGKSIKVEDTEVFVLSPQAPLARIFFEKKVGDIAKFRNMSYVITEIY